MSKIGDALTNELANIQNLKTDAETPEGEPGDDWASEYEKFLKKTVVALNNAAPETIRNQSGEIDANVDNQYTKSNRVTSNTIETDELSSVFFASSITELNNNLSSISNRTSNHDSYDGAKIVLTNDVMTPSPEDLPITIPKDTTIEGQDVGATLIDVSGINKTVFEANGVTNPANDITLRNLMVMGDRNNKLGTGLHIKDVHRWFIDNCGFRYLNHGIIAEGSWNGTLFRTKSTFHNNDGLKLLPMAWRRTNNIKLYSSNFNHNDSDGAYIHKCNGVTISGCDVEQNHEYGLHIDGAAGVMISGGYYENNGKSLDRTGDGSVDPVQIAVSPTKNGPRSNGCSINGATFQIQEGVAIKTEESTGLNIAGNKFTTPKPSSSYVLEVSTPGWAEKINFDKSNSFEDMYPLRGSIHDSKINPHSINNGIWELDTFGGIDNIKHIFNGYTTNNDSSVEIILTSDVNSEINGDDFPSNTLFRGTNSGNIIIHTGTPQPVSLSKDGQKLKNVKVVGTGTSSSGCAVHIPNTGNKQSLENVTVDQSDQDGILSESDNCVMINVNCKSSNISGSDIILTGDSQRVVASNAGIDTTNATNFALAANIDTL